MTHPTLLFSATRDPENGPVGSIQFQINPEALDTPQEAGRWLHNLRLHIAQAFVDFDKSSDQLTTWHDIMTSEGQEVDNMISKAQAADSFKVEF